MVPTKGFKQMSSASNDKASNEESIVTAEAESKVAETPVGTVLPESTEPQSDNVPVTTVTDENTTIVKPDEQLASDITRGETTVYVHIDEPAFAGTTTKSETIVTTRTTAAALLAARLPKNITEYNLALASNINAILKELCVLQKSSNIALEDITSTCGTTMFEYIVNNINNTEVKVLMNILKKEVK